MLDRHRHPDDVAQVLGFSDSRSFSRAFKAWNGVTPSNWSLRVSENVLID
jgi:AraC-like DNA-binding protein